MRRPGTGPWRGNGDAAASADDGCPAIRFGRSIALVVTVCATAGLVAAAGLLLHRAAHERVEVESRALALAHSTAHAAEREVAAAVARLEALSTSAALKRGDLVAFHARLVETPTPPGSWFALRAEHGQLLNTLLPADAALPRDSDLRRPGMMAVADIVREGTPRVTPLAWAPVRGTYVITVSLPVLLGPQRQAVLLQTVLPQERLSAAVLATAVAAPWSATLVDRNGRVIAQAGRNDMTAGQSVPEAWKQRFGEAAEEGLFVAEGAGGHPVLVAFAKPRGVGWAAVVDIPLTVVGQPMREAWLVLGASAAGLVLLATACAWWLRRRVGRLVSLLRLAASEAGQRELRERARFRHYWDHTPEGLFVVQVTPEGDFLFEGLNPAHTLATGLTTADVAGKRPEECLPPDVAAAIRQRYAGCVRRGAALRYEETLDLPGGLRDWETSLAPMRDPRTGRVTALFGTCRDVTERTRAERAVRVNEERLRLAQHAAGAGIWDWDLTTGAMHWSTEMYELLGVQPGAVPPTGLCDAWLGLIHPDDRTAFEARLRADAAGGSLFDVDCRFLRGDAGAELRWMAVRGQIASQEGDSAPRVLGVAVDVTERRRAQIAARESLALLHSSLDALTAQVAILDRTGRIIAANAAYERRIATSGEGAVAPVCADERTTGGGARPPSPGPALVEEAIRFVGRGEVREFRREYSTTDPADGQERWHQLRVTSFGAGEGLRLVAAHEDITEVRRSNEALKDVTGRLLTSQDEERRRIARDLHDTSVQDIAMAMIGIDMAVAARTEDARLASLSEARDLLDRAVRDVRTLSYLLHPPLLDEFGLSAALATYAEGIAKRGGFACTLDLEPTPHDALSPATATALFRVAQEAFANVVRHSGARHVRLGLRVVPGQHVELRVQDDGHGFGSAGAAAPGDGTADRHALGVGIPGMRARLRQLGGQLCIETGEDGTLVVAMVPLAANDAGPAPTALAAE